VGAAAPGDATRVFILLTRETQQDAHLQTVVEVLQSIKASEMTPMLQRIYQGDGGSELLDVLMKYLYVVAPVGSPDLCYTSPQHTSPRGAVS
jgi:actin related protein 2/3 complex subunit 5